MTRLLLTFKNNLLLFNDWIIFQHVELIHKKTTFKIEV